MHYLYPLPLSDELIYAKWNVRVTYQTAYLLIATDKYAHRIDLFPDTIQLIGFEERCQSVRGIINREAGVQRARYLRCKRAQEERG